MPLVRFDLQSQHRRVAYSLAAVGAYVFAFFPLYRLMTGPETAALATVPVFALAWLWGWRVGLVAGLLSLPLNTLLLNLAGQEGWDVVFRQGGGLGQVMIVLVGGGIGRLRDVDRRLKEEITERKRTEERLLQNAMYDPLTELANRKLWIASLRQLTVENGGGSPICSACSFWTLIASKISMTAWGTRSGINC